MGLLRQCHSTSEKLCITLTSRVEGEGSTEDNHRECSELVRRANCYYVVKPLRVRERTYATCSTGVFEFLFLFCRGHFAFARSQLRRQGVVNRMQGSIAFNDLLLMRYRRHLSAPLRWTVDGIPGRTQPRSQKRKSGSREQVSGVLFETQGHANSTEIEGKGHKVV